MAPFIIAGCGFAGATIARLIAEELDEKVIIYERRNHIAGNMFDYYDAHGILIHKYGPHILVINNEDCFDFLSRFTDWTYYEHRVNAEIDGIEVPLPINFTSIKKLYPVQIADAIIHHLVENYGENTSVRILDLKKSDIPLISDFAEFIYKKVFLEYTQKMWGLKPTEMSPAVTGRVPIRLSYDSRHFQQKYQYMPSAGYTELFNKMLDHPHITVKLNTDINQIMALKDDKIYLDGAIYNGQLIYTGSVDELMNYRYGILPYRSLSFQLESWNKPYVQNTSVLNWPDCRPATRRTEMKRLTQQQIPDFSTTITEIPGKYEKGHPVFGEPYYPIVSEDCEALYQKYKQDISCYPQITLAGRLAEYRYYNMEATILNAFKIFRKIKQKKL